MATPVFPANLAQQRQHLSCEAEGPRDVASFGYAGSFASLGVDDSFSLEEFRKNLRIEIKEYSNEKVVFDLINVDVSVANAIRRILIAEVPSVAIETVHLYQNTGVIQDEVLAHRLGLIPFNINPDMLEWRKEREDLLEDNCLKFRLHVKCTEKDIKPGAKSFPVYAQDIHWVPMSKKQELKFSKQKPGPVEPAILITKLRPGQEIEVELFCEKGIGKSHAKWSPVATAVYRLLPKLDFLKGPLRGDEARELKDLCPMGVFDMEDNMSVVPSPRKCTTCRACIERFPGQISLTKNKNYFIFSIEGTGAIPATELFERAIAVLKEKAIKIKENLIATSKA